MTKEQSNKIVDAIHSSFIGSNALGEDVNVGNAIKYVGLQLGKVAEALAAIANAIRSTQN